MPARAVVLAVSLFACSSPIMGTQEVCEREGAGHYWCVGEQTFMCRESRESGEVRAIDEGCGQYEDDTGLYCCTRCTTVDGRDEPSEECT